MKRRVRVYVVGVLGLLLMMQAPAGGQASPGWAWALQWTSLVGAFYRPPTEPLNPANTYYGWIGIKGKAIAPASLPPLQDNNVQHFNGFINIEFASPQADPVDLHLQLGWYTGSLTTITAAGSYHGYLEFITGSGANDITVWDLGTWSLGAPANLRIERDTYTSCWYFYINDSSVGGIGGAPAYTCSVPLNGAAYAGSEVFNYSNYPPVTMKTSYFGDGSTTYRLKLKNATAWEDWDQSLTAGSTARYDQGTSTCGIQPRYYIVHTNLFYNFRTYGGSC